MSVIVACMYDKEISIGINHLFTSCSFVTWAVYLIYHLGNATLIANLTLSPLEDTTRLQNPTSKYLVHKDQPQVDFRPASPLGMLVLGTIRCRPKSHTLSCPPN
jgi:hypothetical protein